MIWSKISGLQIDDVDRGSQARTPANWRYNLLEPEGEWFLDMRITNLVACGWLIPRSMWPLWGHSHPRFVAQARVKLNALGKDANLRCFPSFFLAAHLHHLSASCWKRVLIARIKLPGLIPENTLRCVKWSCFLLQRYKIVPCDRQDSVLAQVSAIGVNVQPQNHRLKNAKVMQLLWCGLVNA